MRTLSSDRRDEFGASFSLLKQTHRCLHLLFIFVHLLFLYENTMIVTHEVANGDKELEFPCSILCSVICRKH